jgi:ribosomal protein S15P/S13E
MKLHKTILLIVVAMVLTVGVSNAQVKQKITDEQLSDLLGRIETSASHFAKSADTAMDKGGYNGSARENELNDILKRFQSATSALKNDHSGPNAKGHFETVLHIGVGIENFLKKYPLDGVQSDWTALRSDLGELASGFNITWEEGHAIGAPVGTVDVKNLCQHIEDVADHFKESLDRALDNSKLNGTATEDEINQFLREFRDGTNSLQDHYNEDRAKDDAKEVLTRGNKINAFLKKHKDAIPSDTLAMWDPVRLDLDRLAKHYGVSWR